jgi:uncharacterized tellurite resistance protein B-like protein
MNVHHLAGVSTLRYRSMDVLPGFWSSLFSSGRPERELLADVVLMTALADGALSEGERDGLARAMREEDELAGISWDWILERAKVLAEDAPLFGDARRAVEEQLADPFRRRQSIALAARVIGADRQLAEEERAILLSLAQGFGIDERETNKILEETGAGSAFVRLRFNDPRVADASTLFDALTDARADDAIAALLFKPRAIRTAMTTLAPGGKLVEVGERMQIGLHQLRIDGTIELGPKKWHLRCLAPNESMHADERIVLKMLAGQLGEDTQVVVVHESELYAADDAFLQSQDPARIRPLQI